MKAVENSMNKALIWDAPTRVFHWLLVSTFITAWISYDDSRHLDVHVFAGYTFLALLIFRLIWGLVGTHYARFKEFAYGWSDVFGYVKTIFTPKELKRYIGHNPAGAWAIFALITLGFVLTISGLFVLGGEEQQGPLAGAITFRQSVIFRELHEGAAFLLLATVGLHVLGVITESLLHKENLIGAMFRGTKWVEGETAQVSTHSIIAAALITGVIAFGITAFGGYLTDSQETPYLPFKGPQLASNELWTEECGACHLAFHPSLLPARSWSRLLDEQENHFEEDLMLDEEVITELRVFSTENAAERELTEAAWRMNTNISADQSPIVITKTRYWKKKHNDIKDEVWNYPTITSKSQCEACHLDAEQGTFEDSAMRIPKPDTNQTK